MRSRLIVAILGIPVLIYIYLQGGPIFLIYSNLIIGVATYEFYSMVKQSGKKCYGVLGILTSLAMVNVAYFRNTIPGITVTSMDILVFVLIFILGYRVIKNQVEDTSQKIGITLLGIIYIGIFLSKMIDISFFKNGGKILLSIQILVWVCDTFAYHVGVNYGRKFFKTGFSDISPNKSKEGAIGACIFTILALFIINSFFSVFPRTLSLMEVIIVGTILSLCINLGDLVESMFKREFKVKDSGKILGGHGGVLDRFDSFIFVVPITYYLIKYLMI